MIADPAMEEEVLLAQQGDREAFGRLILKFERNLYSLARSYLKKDEDCADAVQEAIYKSFRSIKTLKEPAYFKTWLFRILINECIQLLRKQKRVEVANELERDIMEGNAPYEAVEFQEALANLEFDLRAVIRLYYYEDLPLQQIAEILGVPKGTVKSRLHRARTILADELKSSEERNVGHDRQLTLEYRHRDRASVSYTQRKGFINGLIAFFYKRIQYFQTG